MRKARNIPCKKIAKEDLIMMANFVLKNTFFKFNSKAKQQMSRKTIVRNVATCYACNFVDKVKTDFLGKRLLQP